MNLKTLRAGVLSVSWVLALTFALYLLNIGKISPVSGAQFLNSGLLCTDAACAETEPVSLPYFKRPRADDAMVSNTLRFFFDHKTVSSQEVALLFPKIMDDIALSVNGLALRQVDQPGRYWNRPLLITVPPSLLIDGTNEMTITLFAPAQEGLDLQPFHFGPTEILDRTYMTRWLTVVGVGSFNLGLMAVLFVVLGVVWLSRREDRAYLWLSLSCLSACVFLFHYSAETSFLHYKYWTTVWGLSVSLYVLFIMKFLNRLLGFDRLPLEQIYIGFLALSAAIMVLASPAYTYMLMLLVNYGTEFFALAVLVTFWNNRDRLPTLDFGIFYACLSVSAALGLYGLILLSLDEPPRTHQVFQYTPLVMAALCLWLVMSQLVRNLRGYEQLNASLQHRVDQKTAELAESYKRLAKVQQAEAINDERQRIMLDLHDGIGGQLVNTLAYMENKAVGDETLRVALEDALRDLALMLDSLESDDSITTLLGMLRTRLEALLEEHGLEFDWQIKAEPMLKNPSPSNNLHLTRIVQEAITNVIKHADATVIQVASDPNSLIISDNGTGFDVTSKISAGSHGIVGMKRRAEQIGAQLDLQSSSEGTRIQIVLADNNNATEPQSS